MLSLILCNDSSRQAFAYCLAIDRAVRLVLFLVEFIPLSISEITTAIETALIAITIIMVT